MTWDVHILRVSYCCKCSKIYIGNRIEPILNNLDHSKFYSDPSY